MIILNILLISLAAEPISVDDDFQKAGLSDWQNLEATWKHRNGKLHLGGPTKDEIAASRLTYIFKGKDWSDCLTGVTIQKFKGHWAGMCVRKGKAGFYEVCIHEGGGIMVRRQPTARVLTRTQGSFGDGKPHRLEVVTIGPYLRIFVDGKLHTTITDSDFSSGISGLMGHLAHAHFDDYVQTREVPINRGLFVVPSAQADAWIFEPGKPFELPIDLWNATNKELDVELYVHQRPLFVDTLPDLPQWTYTGKLIVRRSLKALQGKTSQLMQMPAMAEGLHHVMVRLERKDFTNRPIMPLGI
jgi:hypothetical protein